MEKILKVLIQQNRSQDISVLQRRFANYIEPLQELFPIGKETDDLLYGLKLLFTYCTYQDKIIDAIHTTEDCFLALYFENAYLKWLTPYGISAIKRYVRSIKRYLSYTKKERNSYENFLYKIDNYLEKEQPIVEHLTLLLERFGEKYEKKIALVKSYYLAVLLIDDVEDILEDVVARHTTLMTYWLTRQGVDLKKLLPQSRQYWLYVNDFLSPWLLEQLKKFSLFKETKIYKLLLSIYENIQYKLQTE